MKYEKLFEPVKVGKIFIKNRIAMAPMGIAGLVNPDGSLTQRAIDYYTERAIGGVGLIISGLTRVDDTIEPRGPSPLVSPASAYSFGELAESVHYYGAKIFIQLTAGLGRVMAGVAIDRGVASVSASANPAYWRPKVTTRALSTNELKTLITAFGNAVVTLKALGIDGVELHGHEGYLFDQFTTALWNKRNDKYGGSLKNRLRFPVEVLEVMKSKAGSDYPVIYRYGLKHYIKAPWSAALPGEHFKEMGRDIEEGLEMTSFLEEAGFDALHVDAGSYDSWYWAHPPLYQSYGCMVDMAEKVKKIVNIPVITVGRLDVPELAEKVLQEGKADIIALGRALLADPHWPKKVHEGKIEDIRPCIGCHDGCLGRMIHDHKPLSCATNPSTGRERIYTIIRTTQPKKVLIAGGGVAGMEAARVASLKGDDVTLYERSKRLGGHLIEASVPDFKVSIKWLLNWYETQLKKMNVRVKLDMEVTKKLVKQEKPHKIVIATGSIPIMPNTPGVRAQNTATCIDLLLGRKKAGKKVVVLGGGLVGCETALWLARNGKEVTIVEMLPEIGVGIFHANRIMLIDMLTEKKVKVLTSATIEEIGGKEVVIIDCNSRKSTYACDTVALGVGLKSCNELYDSLKTEFTEVYVVGDCNKPGRILNAIWDGFTIGMC